MEGGDRVTVLTPHASGVPARWEDQGVEARSFRYAPQGQEVLGYSRSLNADERVRWGAGLVAPLYLLGARRGLRRLLDTQPFDLLHAHWVVPNALVASPAARRVPLAVGLHGSDVFLAEHPLVRGLVSRALRKTTLLTGCSPELVSRICDLGFDESRARVIPYGVDVTQFSPGPERHSLWRGRLGIPPAAVVALSVGRMVTKKGYQVLMDALPGLMNAHTDLHIVLAGGGDRQEEFRQAAAAWSDRVHFPGAVLRNSLPDLFRAADLFVLPAVHDPKGNVDGLPNVILEAMATGLPVVASKISGIPLAIEDGQAGILVAEGEPKELGQALGRLIRDVDMRARMGRAGRHKAVSELTWSTIAGRYRQVYEEALANLGEPT